MYVDLVLLDEDLAELVGNPRVELADHSCSVEVVEYLYLDEWVGQ
jgi:hypothetical protein